MLSKVDKVYLSAPQKIVIIDHEKKRTFVLRKEGLPDVGALGQFFLTLQFWSVKFYLQCPAIACGPVFHSHGIVVTISHFAVVWNPWDKKAKAMPDFGDDEYKNMLCVGAAAIEKPITLKSGEEWLGKQEISAVPSSYSSGQLDPEVIRRMHTI